MIPAATNFEMGEDIPRKEGAKCNGIWLFLIGTEATKPKKLQHPAIAELLKGFKGLFKEPT